jgi:outer membrane biosynthesis protein TonB
VAKRDNALLASRNKRHTKSIELVFPDRGSDQAACPDLEWLSRKPPVYGRKSQDKGYVGAAVIKYSIDENGIPYDIRIKAEVPNKRFGQKSVDTVRKWRVDMSKLPGNACITDLVTNFIFQFR